MTPDRIAALFTRADGSYACARWGRPIAPVVFGVEDATLGVLKGAVEAVAALARHPVAETDPELGANFILFFFRDWSELLGVPNLGEMVPDLNGLVARLETAVASRYRTFRFDDSGAIMACFAFLRVGPALADEPVEAIALTEAVAGMLTWSDTAFSAQSPLAVHPDTGAAVLRPDIAGVIAAAYDPVMPAASSDPSHALRLHARMQGAG